MENNMYDVIYYLDGKSYHCKVYQLLMISLYKNLIS